VGRPPVQGDPRRRDARSEELTVLLYLSIAMAASVLMALGLLMMKSRAADLPMAAGANIIGAVVAWLRDPMWMGGLALQTAGWACYVIAVSQAPVSMVAVVMQAGIALFVVASVLILGERASPREWVGIGAIVFGMVMLTLSLSGGEAEGKFEPEMLLVFAALVTLAGLAPMAVARMSGRGAAAAIVAGVAFGLGAMFTKSMTLEFTAGAGGTLLRVVFTPYVYCMLAANIIGIVLLQNSFHSARAIIAMPLSGALSNIVPIVGGMIVFGERLPQSSIAAAMRVGAFVLTIAAGALLAGSRDEQPAEPIAVRAAAAVKS
jgi:drug/metabolite transporter (DMT)-like permease